MSGFFGIASKKDCLQSVFFGVDYHSHLGTRRGGLATYNKETGFQRQIHDIENSPFRTKFEHCLEEMHGTTAIGIISDYDPQPLLMRSRLGTYAICVVGRIINAEQLVSEYFSSTGGHFNSMSGSIVNCTEIVGALIGQKDSFEEGIRYAQSLIDGTCSILILKDDGALIVARDRYGRVPVLLGKSLENDGFAVSFESFAYKKMGFDDYMELGPGQIVQVTADGVTELAPALEEMRMCAFLWTYYGYPNSNYEGVNVELMRYKNGQIMAQNDKELLENIHLDYACGVPDSGISHAIGYANESRVPFARPYIKYTPTWARSFLLSNQEARSKIAKMKQIAVHELIKDKDLLFVDDSIVRGTQLKETVDFLKTNGAKSVHMRSACPPIMYGCKYLNFTRVTSDMELLARRVVMELEGEEGFKYLAEYSDGSTERGKSLRKVICEKFGFDSLEFQTLEGVIKSIGIEPCKLCTYCWTGKE